MLKNTVMKLLLILAVFAVAGPKEQCWAAQLRLLVPAYGNPCCPGGQEMWVQLTDTASLLGSDLLVILNPASGPGVDLIDPNYVNDSAQGPFIDFRNASGVAIGYVGTDWAKRPLGEVQAEVDLYFDPCLLAWELAFRSMVFSSTRCRMTSPTSVTT